MNVLMLNTLEPGGLTPLLELSREFDQTLRSGREQAFFSARSIYESTAFTQISRSGEETDFLGNVVIAPNGRLGFAPSVVLTGDVAGVGIHDFLAEQIAQGRSNDVILSGLLSGDDTIFGNQHGAYLQGFAGDDVLLPGDLLGYRGTTRGSSLDGGDGDDVLFAFNADYLDGGEGSDRFVFYGDYVAESSTSKTISDFENRQDKILLDKDTFPEIGRILSKDEISFYTYRNGGSHPEDRNDRILVTFYDDSNLAFVSYDPDGSGQQPRVSLALVETTHQLSRGNFALVDANALMPHVAERAPAGTVAIEHDTALPFEHPRSLPECDLNLLHPGVHLV